MKYVTIVGLPLRHPVPQFDVLFPGKLLKIVAILEAKYFSLKFTK